MESQSGTLALSSDDSTIDLKDFLSKGGRSRLAVVAISLVFLLVELSGEKQLQGLHRLAAQGDRTGIMKYMKVKS